VTQDPADPTTARRDAARRIGRFLRGLERARRQPNRREAYHLRIALDHLRAEQYADSTAAMVNAERCAPLPAHVAGLVTTNDIVTVAQLQRQLEETLTAKS
jgi:hypothetical protein